MTVLGAWVTRKRMLMLLVGLFVVGNVVSATAPAFGVMLAGRVIASLAHGAFFGIGSVVAADLVAPQKRAGAISMMFTGLTAANVVGAPMGTFIRQNVGWRVTFFVVAALGVIGLLGVAVHDKFAAAVTIVLIGGVGFATVPPLQTRVLDQASAAPTLTSAVNIGAFNLGNALSAWLGGLVIAAGLGYTAPDWVGAAPAASAPVLALISGALERRRAGRGRLVARHSPESVMASVVRR